MHADEHLHNVRNHCEKGTQPVTTVCTEAEREDLEHKDVGVRVIAFAVRNENDRYSSEHLTVDEITGEIAPPISKQTENEKTDNEPF